MVAYFPSDNPQSTQYAAAARDAHIQEYQNFGPPPSNYYTAYRSHGEGMIYAEHNVNDTITSIAKGASQTHPCSPAGLARRPNIAKEMTFQRGWASALATALQKKGITRTPDQLIANYETLIHSPAYKKASSDLLWNPGDRKSAVFKDEPAAALVARWGALGRPFSLNIICPFVPADGVGYTRIYDTHNRPPIYGRFSVGDQGIYEPLILMCLPKLESDTGRESYYKDVDWFSMEPVPNSEFAKTYKDATRKYEKSHIERLMKAFEFDIPRPDIFLWTLVRLHRHIIFGVPISDLGSWIQQYCVHIKRCGVPYDGSKHKFVYDANKTYKGQNLTFETLTAWIMNPEFGDGSAVQIALEWDITIDALITYNLDRTDANWSDFRAKMKASSKPFW